MPIAGTYHMIKGNFLSICNLFQNLTCMRITHVPVNNSTYVRIVVGIGEPAEFIKCYSYNIYASNNVENSNCT